MYYENFPLALTKMRFVRYHENFLFVISLRLQAILMNFSMSFLPPTYTFIYITAGCASLSTSTQYTVSECIEFKRIEDGLEMENNYTNSI